MVHVWDRAPFVPAAPTSAGSLSRSAKGAEATSRGSATKVDPDRHREPPESPLRRPRFGIRPTASPTCVSIRAPRSRIKVSLLTCRFSLLPPANCQPGGRTRAATRMAGLSGAHVSEGNAESCNPILTRLHIAERTEQPPVRNGASLRYPEMGESIIHETRFIRTGIVYSVFNNDIQVQ